MIRRRAQAAGIKTKIGCHTFRATGITAYLENGGTLEHTQQVAAHESPRTTKLYDRTATRSASTRSIGLRFDAHTMTYAGSSTDRSLRFAARTFC